MYFGFPLRGTISHGLVTNDCHVEESNQNIMHHQIIGAPIINAVSFEKVQKWSGCMLDNSVLEHVEKTLAPMCPNHLILYNVPTKENELTNGLSTKKAFAVSWPYGCTDDVKFNLTRERIREAFADHGKKVDEKVEEMVGNTYQFYLDVLDHPSAEDFAKIIESIRNEQNELE